MSVGYLGYFAFGNSSKSVIIYNLPNEDIMSIVIKCCYLITVMGSFVLLSQPVFHVIESTLFY
jgi:amino acid permease